MRRATITIPDDLDTALASYLDSQEAAPSLTAVVEAALRRYLQEKELEARQYRRARGPLRITPAPEGSGFHDVSVEHDRYSADQE